VLLLMLASSLPAAAAEAIFSDDFEGCGAAENVVPGAGAALLLRGTVVTPDTAFAGEVLVSGDTIACAAASCAAAPQAADATIVQTHGLIFPGLIDTHNFVLFDIFDADDWSPPQLYDNHDGWTTDTRYGTLVDATQYLNGEGSPLDYGCEMDKYAEIKALLGGTTSIVGHAGASNRACYGSLARTIDMTVNDLGADYVRTATLAPDKTTADSVCADYVDGDTHAFLVNVGEGTDATALNEFTKLGTVSTSPGCLYAPQTAIAHGSALGDAEFTTMAAAGMSLTWMPRSNVALYGATADVPLALAKGINVSLAPNWSITGSRDLLAELRFARAYADAHWSGALSDSDLVAMVTTRAARVLGLQDDIGRIAAGRKADLTVVAGSCAGPQRALIEAQPADVRLVLVGGVPLYGDAALQAAAPAAPGCDALDVCGSAKFVCVAETGGTVSNKLGQTLADITGALSQALTDYDALNLTPWKFAPIAPLVEGAPP
jgi:hypothetical protein